VQEPIKQRVARLRDEIAQIMAASRIYFERRKNPSEEPDHARRMQRLEEIQSELRSLTDWKKP
jgi:transcriptional regulator of NAD metabolism